MTSMAMLLPVALMAAAPNLPATAQFSQIITVDPVSPEPASDANPVMRVSYPAQGDKLPVVIFSHGNRLSRSDYQPLVNALVLAGYVVIQPDHPDASIAGFVPPGTQPADSWRTRVVQLGWIARNLTTIVRRVPGLGRRIDSSRVALVGHSFGGHSVALAMGAQVEGEQNPPPLKGVSAAVLLAPPGHFDGLVEAWKRRSPYLRTDWRAMRGPVLIVNGENDDSAMTDQGPSWHDDAFNRASSGQGICRKLLPGVGHYLGGIDSPLRPPAGDATPERRAAVLDLVVSFIDAKLGNGPAASERWAEARKALTCK